MGGVRKGENLEMSVYLTAGCFAVLSHEATAPNWKQRRRGARPRRCGRSLGGSDKRAIEAQMVKHNVGSFVGFDMRDVRNKVRSEGVVSIESNGLMTSTLPVLAIRSRNRLFCLHLRKRHPCHTCADAQNSSLDATHLNTWVSRLPTYFCRQHPDEH